MKNSLASDLGQKIKLYGEKVSDTAYEIRDFLNRNAVEVDWVELTCDADCHRELDLPTMDNIRLPIIELADGSRLFAPTIYEIARRLGWIAQPKFKEYDVSIFGAGPAGLSAAVYAASEGLRTILVEREVVGGQAGTSSLIENYLGFAKGISGADLAEQARQQAVNFGVEILLLQEGVRGEFRNNRIYVDLADGSELIACANICASGIEYRKLNLPNAETFLHAGLFYGAGVSEATMCESEQVYVIGGGNSAGQAVMHFSSYAKKVTMLVRSETLSTSMSEYLLDRIQNADNVEVLFNSEVTKLEGDEVLEQITIANSKENTEQQKQTHYLFVCIGGSPNTEWAKDTNIIRDEAGYLVTGSDLLESGKAPECWPLEREPFFLETSVPGCFAVGDVRHGSVKRVASAVGEGAMAVSFVHKYLKEVIWK